MGTMHEKSDAELIHAIFDAERSLMAARMKKSMNQLENTAQLSNLRKQIARMQTEARRRELEQGLRKDALIHEHRQTYKASAGETEPAAEKGGFLSGIVDKLSGQD